jgi:hypothetical protein
MRHEARGHTSTLLSVHSHPRSAVRAQLELSHPTKQSSRSLTSHSPCVTDLRYRERTSQWRPDGLGGNQYCSKVELSPTNTRCLLPRSASGRHWEVRSLYVRKLLRVTVYT